MRETGLNSAARCMLHVWMDDTIEATTLASRVSGRVLLELVTQVVARKSRSRLPCLHTRIASSDAI